MLYVDKDNAHPPSIEIAKAKRVLKTLMAWRFAMTLWDSFKRHLS